MLRIHVERQNGAPRLRLEGKLIKPWVDELLKVWMDLMPGLAPGERIAVDLSAVSYVDDQGKAALTAMRRGGGELSAADPFIADVVEEIETLAKAQP